MADQDAKDRPTLLPNHTALITASSISAELAAARGYRSITAKSQLQELGFGLNQRRVPALLIPIYNVHGDIALHQIRPESPRCGPNGKPIKYETPSKARMVLDVPPMARPWIGDPARPLFITEGVRKADAAVSRGLCCIDVLGVWNWRGRNERDGLTALADWESIALKGRDVYIAFDSDATTKSQVQAALNRLRRFLESKGAGVKVILLPSGEGGVKLGLDDYLAAGHNVEQLLALATDVPLPTNQHESHSYRTTPEGLIYLKPLEGGVVPVPLTNFTAEITGEIALDDGVEIQLQFEIEARLKERTSRFAIPGKQFGGMSWAMEHLGAQAIIYPGMTLREHARAAIQLLSESVESRRIYSHLGWQRIDDHDVYLHAGGGIGTEGVIAGIEVAPPVGLNRFVLPAPPQGVERIAAIRASLGLRDVGPARLTIPVLAAVYRAPLGRCDLSLHLVGPTGEGKTTLAVLIQQHHGSLLDSEHVPGSWSSTGNALEVLAFHAKDTLLLVDDFVTRGTQTDVQRMNREAERLLRAQANASGRGRLRPDGTLRPDKPPRGVILSTGEDIPRGQSLRARTWVLEVSPGDLNWNAISTAQQHAAAGLYAQAFSCYVQWLAARLPGIQSGLRDEIRNLRDLAVDSSQHRRTPFMVANLAVGLRYFLTFAREVEAVTDAEAKNLWQTGMAALKEAASAQQQHIVDEEPTRRYLEFLRAAIASGRAHIADPDGAAPPDPRTWGWSEYSANGAIPYSKPLGSCIGWIDGKDLYLEPEAAHAVAQQQAGAGGDSLAITSKTLHKRLFEKKRLLSREGSRQTYTMRRTLQGARRRVLHLAASSLMPQETDQPARPDQQPDEDAEDGVTSAESGAGSWAGQEPSPAQQPAQTTPESPAKTTVAPPHGQVGQVGQVLEEIDNRPSNASGEPREQFDL